MIKTSNFEILWHVPHATNFYGKFENLNFDIFCKKWLFQIKTAITFAYGLEKKTYTIWKTIYTKFYIRLVLSVKPAVSWQSVFSSEFRHGLQFGSESGSGSQVCLRMCTCVLVYCWALCLNIEIFRPVYAVHCVKLNSIPSFHISCRWFTSI
jgi:hypothetical protein